MMIINVNYSPSPTFISRINLNSHYMPAYALASMEITTHLAMKLVQVFNGNSL